MGRTLTSSLVMRVVVCLAMAVFAFAPMASAQSQGTGQIVGTVFDASGAAIPNAKVVVTGKATGLVREMDTNAEGGYRIVLLPPGPYTVEVKQQGFKSFKADVNVSVGSAVTVDARLQVGQVTEVVEVTATTVIETTAVQTDALINQRSISELPINGRRFHDFVQLTPTVQIEPQRNGISFAGQRGINSNVTIDGHDYNQPFFGGIRGGERSNNAFSIPQEAISEFQIVPYGYSAEYGRSTAGVMNAVTKSGTNDWHASGFYFLRHKEIAKKDAFNRQALDNQHQFGGSFGGPVRHDKSFFFVAAEQQLIDNPRVVVFRRLDSITRDATNGEAFDFYRGLEQSFSQTNDATSILGRWDEQFTANHRVAIRYHWSTNTAKNAVATGDQIFPETNNSLDNNGTEGDRQHTVTGQWTGIFSPRIVNEFRGQYSWEKRPRVANDDLAGTSTTIGNTGTRNFLSTTQKDYRVQLSDNLNWNIGTHSLKFGGEFNHLFADQFFKFNQFGIFALSGTNANLHLQIMTLDATNPTDFRFNDTSVAYRVNIGNGLAKMTMRESALFIQDQWRITPRLTLTAGFRWEGYWNPEPDTSNSTLTAAVRNFTFPFGRVDPGFIPNNLKQFMPRLGLAWDPWGNARTVIRMNAGLYYARSPLLLFAGPINNFRTPAGDLTAQLPLSISTCPPIPPGFPAGLSPTTYCRTVFGQFLFAGINLNNITLANLGTLPPLTMAQIQTIATGLGLTFDPNQGVQPTTWADDYEAPRSWQWNVAFEHEVTRGFSIGADVVYINTIHLQRNRDWNVPNPFIFGGAVRTSGTVTATFPLDASKRPCFALVGGSVCTPSTTISGTTVSVPTISRPISSLGQVQVRETNARALYRGITLRSSFRRSRYQVQTYYTISTNYSDDDNERSAGGDFAQDPFNLRKDYNYSRLDARHNLVLNGVVELPWDFVVSGLARLRSARPIDPGAGSFSYTVSAVSGTTATTGTVSIAGDSNGDRGGPDRPYSAPGVPFLRNSFRDRAIYATDFRVAKKIKLPREGMFVNFTVDFFNVFNFKNITYGSLARTYGPGISPVTAAVVTPNAAFQQLINPADCLAARVGGNKNCYDVNNNPGGPFQMQIGVRFQF